MSWIGWLLLAAVVALVFAALRGIVRFASSLIEESFRGRREYGRFTERESSSKPESSRDLDQHDADKKQTVRVSSRAIGKIRKPSRLGRFWERVKTALAKKDFDYWVARALSEDDPAAKIEALSNALRLNPEYLPAWGMKINALMGLGKYEEAIPCLEESLERHPRAATWHKRGICCYHLGRLEEASQCLRNARDTCPGEDRELADDIERMAARVASALRAAKAS